MFVVADDDQRDDLLFYVKRGSEKGESVMRHTDAIMKGKDINNKESSDDAPYFVLRKTNPKLPEIGAKEVDWYATFYLNLVIQQFNYRLTVAVCRNRGNKMLLRDKVTVDAFATPSKRQMEKKGTVTQFTFPHLFFSIDDYEGVFKDMAITREDSVCVELSAHAVCGTQVRSTAIFSGTVHYRALHGAHRAHTKSSWDNFTKSRRSYLSMRGPAGRGEAQVAIDVVADATENSLSTIFGALGKLRLTRSQSGSSEPDLSVLLTWVNITWTDIIEDVIGLRSVEPVFLRSYPVPQHSSDKTKQ